MISHSKNISENIQRLRPLVEALKTESSPSKKLNLICRQPLAEIFFASRPNVKPIIDRLPVEKRVGLAALVALGEGDSVFTGAGIEKIEQLASDLETTELFYNTIGGVAGYYLNFLNLLNKKETKNTCVIEPPQLFDFGRRKPEMILSGLQNLEKLAAFFPVGGAADRLGLNLPAANLPFCGRPLLEGLFRDLQGLEYLHEKLFGKKVVIPAVLMTSPEKKNDARVRALFEENRWFSRPKNSIHFLKQPLVPVITEEGRFAFSSPAELKLKPGGHGVIWKLALDQGLFKTFKGKKGLARQINNPVAGLNDNLLSLIGAGFSGDKTFGTLTCDRPPGISEGMLVLKKTKNTCCLTNIEYTERIPDQKGYSNTNILFVDLKEVKKSIQKHPLPGLTINLKSKFPTIDGRQVPGGRLETIMQGIADDFVYSRNKKEPPSFAICKPRYQVSSTTKRLHGSTQTPAKAFSDLQKNHHDLFSTSCGMKLGSSCIIDYHPALGPLYSIIGQKVQGGSIASGSELTLEIAELDMRNLDLDGSLRIIADSPYSGNCRLIDAAVKNRGLDRSKIKDWWKGDYPRKEACEIIIHGNGEFHAEGIEFSGPMRIEVPDGVKITAVEKDGRIDLIKENIYQPTWSWSYRIDKNLSISLTCN